MKSKKVFTAIIFFIVIILIIFFIINYKSKKSGNNINIQSRENVEEYILNINGYGANIEITVKSNKNENIYNMKQVSKDKYSYQETLDDKIQKIIVENKNGTITIKNTKFKLEKIYENYDYMLENTLYLTTFIEEYKNAEKKEIKENEKYYIVDIKIKNNKNKYIAYKKLYINKESKKIEKLEIEDINKNRTIYILYKEITINN